MKIRFLLFAIAFIVLGVTAVFSGMHFGNSSEFGSNTINAPGLSVTDRQDLDQRLRDLGVDLPSPSPSLAIYKRVVIVGNIAYVSGHIPLDESGTILAGKLGDNVEVEQGRAAARRCAIGVLASLKQELGSLNKIKRLIKTNGMVNCTSDFVQQPEVINGFSQLLVDLLGDESGMGARAAVGMVSLPRGAICEVDAIFELHD